MFFTALCATAPEEAGSFIIITAASHDGLADIHDRRPLTLLPAAARDWLDGQLIPPPGDMLADVYILQTESFAWQPVSSDVGTVRNDSASLIVAIDTPKSDPALSTVLVDNMCASPLKNHRQWV